MFYTSENLNGKHVVTRTYIAHVRNENENEYKTLFSKKPFTVPTEAHVSYALYRELFYGFGRTIKTHVNYNFVNGVDEPVELKSNWSVQLTVIGYNATHVLIEPVYPNRVNEQGRNTFYDSRSYPIPTEKCVYVDPDVNWTLYPDAETRYMIRADQISMGRQYTGFDNKPVNTDLKTIVFEMKLDEWFTLAGLYENAYRLTRRSYVSKATWKQKKYFNEASIKVGEFVNIFKSEEVRECSPAL